MPIASVLHSNLSMLWANKLIPTIKLKGKNIYTTYKDEETEVNLPKTEVSISVVMPSKLAAKRLWVSIV